MPRKPVPVSTSLPAASNDAELICGCHAAEKAQPDIVEFRAGEIHRLPFEL